MAEADESAVGDLRDRLISAEQLLSSVLDCSSSDALGGQLRNAEKERDDARDEFEAARGRLEEQLQTLLREKNRALQDLARASAKHAEHEVK